MTHIKPFITRHLVLTYFALVFAISWGGMILVVGPSRFFGTNWQSGSLFLLVALAATFAPGIAGTLLTALISGRTGVRELVSRLLQWRVAPRWYAVALLTAPLVTTATLLVLSLFSPEFLPRIFTTGDPVALLLPGIAAGLMGGILEELGWTGFAIPRLRLGYGILPTGLGVGLLWGAWHFPLFSGQDSFSAALPLALLLARLFSWLPAYRVLMVWVYDRTGSLLVAWLMHASLIATQLTLLPLTLSGVGSLTSTLVWAATLWIFVAWVAAVDRGHLLAHGAGAQTGGSQPSPQPPLRQAA